MTKLFNTLLTSDKQDDFTKAVNSIKTRGTTLQLDIQTYLVAVGARWKDTGDVRPAVLRTNMLLNNMPDGIRANAVRSWVEAFFGFVFCEEGENKGQFVAGTVKGKELSVEAMSSKANHWYKFTPEAPYQPFNLAAELLKLVEKAQKKIENGDPDLEDIPADLLTSLDALIPTE